MSAEEKNDPIDAPDTAERTGRVLKLLPGGRMVIDLGLRDDVRVDDVFAIYEPGETIVDPDSGETLGVIERVKAHAIAEHVQPRLTQLGTLPEPSSSTSSARVLSAVLADTTPAPRNSAPGRRARTAVGDGVRRLIRR